MSNDVAVYDYNASENLPARLQGRGDVANKNHDLAGEVSSGFPVLSIKGKVWHLQVNKQRVLITNNDAHNSPAQAIEMVLVKANPKPSKTFYKNGYVEGSDEPPECYSENGIEPNPDSKEKQALQCAACPWNQWGSRPTAASPRAKACSDVARVALVPASELDRAMLLRVPAGSLQNLKAYGDYLTSKGCTYQDVVTRISFDHTVAHQKLLFQRTRFLTDQEYAAVQATAEDPVVRQICGLDQPVTATPAPAPVAPQPAMQPAPPAHPQQLPAGRPQAPVQAPQTVQAPPMTVAIPTPAQAPAMGAPGALGAPSFGQRPAQAPQQAVQPQLPQPTMSFGGSPAAAPPAAVPTSVPAAPAPEKKPRKPRAQAAPVQAAPVQAAPVAQPVQQAPVQAMPNFGTPAPVPRQAPVQAAPMIQPNVQEAQVIGEGDDLMESLRTLDSLASVDEI